MNKSLHIILIKICTSRAEPLFHSVSSLTPHCVSIHCATSIKRTASIHECQWVPFYLHEGIQLHCFASHILPCQIPFCHTAPLLWSVAWKQYWTEYWWQGSVSTTISPAPASDNLGQQNKKVKKKRGIAFGAVLIFLKIDKGEGTLDSSWEAEQRCKQLNTVKAW